jgi:hypothetical protein
MLDTAFTLGAFRGGVRRVASPVCARELLLAALAVATLTLAAVAPSASAALAPKPNSHLVGMNMRNRENPAMIPDALGVSTSGDLVYHGGPVVHSSAPYLIFWAPSGDRIPASSRSLLIRYFTDVAADSGRSSNLYGVLRQYHDRGGFAGYRQTFNSKHQLIIDTQPYPPRALAHCPDVVSAYPTCISDGQLGSELKRLIAARGLPTAGPISTARRAGEFAGKVPLYFVVLPADVSVCQSDATFCTDNKMCAYHSRSSDAGNAVLYAAIPMRSFRFGWPKICQLDNQTAVQEPNGNIADVLISLLSHEDSEMITDPMYSGWAVYGSTALQSTLTESGDKCNVYGPFNPVIGFNPNAFAPTLGGSANVGTLYDELINGHRYYTQSEWSNGDGNCEMRPSAGRVVPRFSVPRKPRAGASVSFNPAASTGTSAYSSATWKFGDGSKPRFFSAGATLAQARHRYRRAGSYTVTLILIDDRGNLGSRTKRVTVEPRRM